MVVAVAVARRELLRPWHWATRWWRRWRRRTGGGALAAQPAAVLTRRSTSTLTPFWSASRVAVGAGNGGAGGAGGELGGFGGAGGVGSKGRHTTARPKSVPAANGGNGGAGGRGGGGGGGARRSEHRRFSKLARRPPRWTREPLQPFTCRQGRVALAGGVRGAVVICRSAEAADAIEGAEAPEDLLLWLAPEKPQRWAKRSRHECAQRRGPRLLRDLAQRLGGRLAVPQPA